MSPKQIEKRPPIGDIMVTFQNLTNDKKITNASQGKTIVPCKDVRRPICFWASILKAEVSGTMPSRFRRNFF